jgi:hypothetical protein
VPDFPVKLNTGHRTLHHLVRVRFWSLRRRFLPGLRAGVSTPRS